MLETQPGLALFQQGVDDLLLEGERVCGVRTQMGLEFSAKTVVLTVGTFLGGQIHVGEANYQGGRAGDPPSNALAARLRELPFTVERLKTGTPPRLDGATLDFSQMLVQPGDEPLPSFSFMASGAEHPRQVPCHITATTEHTHDIIRAALHRSPMFTGVIEGVGPRYCPSVEDKVVRFADKTSHQIFVEPEGLTTAEIYPNGISTSLPFDVQCAFVRSIPGFENARITRPGYAIEYDFFDPRDLRATLETRFIEGLYFAGQINGTTGYEEAAAQGLLAGINAALAVQGRPSWCPGRHEAYIGVLVDDLITRGTSEPYRMFTSRAEHRLLLREDNADLRLTPHGRELGLVDDERWRRFEAKRGAIEAESARLRAILLRPGDLSRAEIDALGFGLGREQRADEVLRRPEIDYRALTALVAVGDGTFFGLDDRARDQVAAQVEIQAKYAGYIRRQQEEIERHQRHGNTSLPDDIDYSAVTGLSSEVRQKLAAARPASLGQAARISGVTPAAISLLLVHLKKRRELRRSA